MSLELIDALAGPVVATPPTDFPWDHAAYPLGTVTVQKQVDGTFVGSCGLNKEWVIAQLGAAAWPKIYVAPTGNDTTGTGTLATPHRSLKKCIEAANASGQDSIVMAPAGYWSRASLPQGVIPSVHMAFTGIMSQKSIYFCGDDAQSGWDFLGGSATGAFRISCKAASAGTRVIVGADNCTGKYDGDPGYSSVNALSTNCVNGLTIFTNCKGSAASSDNINFHDIGDIAYAADGRFHIMINCRAHDSGSGPTTRSANPLTSHDRCVGIDIAGRYGDGRGVSIHIVDSAQLWVVAATA